MHISKASRINSFMINCYVELYKSFESASYSCIHTCYILYYGYQHNLFNILDLRKAMSRREIEELEKAIDIIKKNGLEVQLARELRDANEILHRLRKIQRIRSEILELKQSTVAEIRSYQKPPPVVHTVMTATFLILGHAEKETKVKSLPSLLH